MRQIKNMEVVQSEAIIKGFEKTIYANLSGVSEQYIEQTGQLSQVLLESSIRARFECQSIHYNINHLTKEVSLIAILNKMKVFMNVFSKERRIIIEIISYGGKDPSLFLNTIIIILKPEMSEITERKDGYESIHQ